MGVYQNAIEYFKRVADSRYVAAGLTSNVDLLVRWDTGVIQKWVDQYATGPLVKCTRLLTPKLPKAHAAW